MDYDDDGFVDDFLVNLAQNEEVLARKMLDQLPIPLYQEPEIRLVVWNHVVYNTILNALSNLLQPLNPTIMVYSEPIAIARGSYGFVFKINDTMVLRIEFTQNDDVNVWKKNDIDWESIMENSVNNVEHLAYLQRNAVDSHVYRQCIPYIHSVAYRHDIHPVHGEDFKMYSLTLTNTRIHIEAMAMISDYIDIIPWNRWQTVERYNNDMGLNMVIADILDTANLLLDMGIFLIDPSPDNIVLTKNGVKILDFHDSCVTSSLTASILCAAYFGSWYTMLPELRVFLGHGDWAGISVRHLAQLFQFDPENTSELDVITILQFHQLLLRIREFISKHQSRALNTEPEVSHILYTLKNVHAPDKTAALSFESVSFTMPDSERIAQMYTNEIVPIPSVDSMFTPSYQKKRFIFLLAEMIRFTFLELFSRSTTGTLIATHKQQDISESVYDLAFSLMRPMWHPDPNKRAMPSSDDIKRFVHEKKRKHQFTNSDPYNGKTNNTKDEHKTDGENTKRRRQFIVFDDDMVDMVDTQNTKLKRNSHHFDHGGDVDTLKRLRAQNVYIPELGIMHI